MKKIALLIMAIFMAAATGVSAKSGPTISERFGTQDTIIVKMANGAKMILHLQNMQQLKAFENYSLDSLMRELNKYVQESKSGQNQQITVNMGSDQDTAAVTEEITVTVQETGKDGKVNKETHKIRIGKNIKIDVDIEEEDGNTKVNVNSSDDDDDDEVKHEKKYKATNFNFDLDLGLNAFANTSESNNPELADFTPDLKPIGSRFVGLNMHLVSQIGGQKSPLHLVSGFEFAFNNFMFDKNYVIRDVDNTTRFTKVEGVEYEKSKLAMSSVNIPVMPMLHFKRANGKDGFHIGAGGFAGYRLGTHSKLKYEEDGDTKKDKDRSNYNLSDVQYGLTGVVGYNNVTFFMKYNMNPLFKENRGADVNVVSFGLRLMN